MAGGLSRRFGRNKLLEPWRGKALLRRVVEAALHSQLSAVHVVTGFEHEQVQAALADLLDDPRLMLHFNPSFDTGQSSTIRCGIAAISGACDGAMFLVGDQPLVNHHLIDRLIEAFAQSRDGICYPVCRGERRNPVIFASAFLPELLQLTGDRGGRAVIERHPEAGVPVEFSDAPLFHDIDRPDDVARIDASESRTGEENDLLAALGLQASRVIALCGSGGKTALMAELVRAFARNPVERILATTTTKLGAEEVDGPWHPQQTHDPAQLDAPAQDTRPILAFHRLDAGRQRLYGFSPAAIDAAARTGRFTRIVVEADGSRRRPLKAPDAAEPVFPGSTDAVVAVAGLSGIGLPLDAATVFRPERWSALTGLPIDHAITPDALARVIVHPDGLMRGAPPHARRVVLLNQADTPARRATAAAVVERLAALPGLVPHRVVVAQLQPQPQVFAQHALSQQQENPRDWK